MTSALLRTYSKLFQRWNYSFTVASKINSIDYPNMLLIVDLLLQAQLGSIVEKSHATRRRTPALVFTFQNPTVPG
jgi:hypothetical protein